MGRIPCALVTAQSGSTARSRCHRPHGQDLIDRTVTRPLHVARPLLSAILFPWFLNNVCVGPLAGCGADHIMRTSRERGPLQQKGTRNVEHITSYRYSFS